MNIRRPCEGLEIRNTILEYPLKTANTYFPNLDALRALACLAVFVTHTFGYLNNREHVSTVESWIHKHLIQDAGSMGVSLFFVLSGYLITYLLLQEKESTGKIKLLYFYMKRILRIWPMFYVVLVAGFVVIPMISGSLSLEPIKEHLPWFITFTNNFDLLITDFSGINNNSLGVLWSVAVEEQFYLFWPLIIMFTNRKNFPFVASALILISAIYRHTHSTSVDHLSFCTFSVMGDLAVGGILAYFGYYSKTFRTFFSEMKSQWRVVAYVILGFIIANHSSLLTASHFAALGRIALTLCFAFIIADQCFSGHVRSGLSRIPGLNKMGVISYGFYCLHVFSIIIFQKLNAVLGYTKISTAIFYSEFVGAFILSFMVSFLSYRYFESKFLKLKPKFQYQIDQN